MSSEDIKTSARKRQLNFHQGSIVSAPVEIGVGTNINGRITIKGLESCKIGNYCAIGTDVRINTSEHILSKANMNVALQKRVGADPVVRSNGSVEIGHNVYIGDSVVILPGCKIGHGSVLAAGAVVSKDVSPFSVVGGVPAKVIKFRFSEEVISQLLELEWWLWPEEKMIENRVFFNLDLTESLYKELRHYVV